MKRLFLSASWCLLLIFMSGLFAQNCLADETWAPGPANTTYVDIVAPSSTNLTFGIDNLSTGATLPLFSTDTVSSAIIYFSESNANWTAAAYSFAGAGPTPLGPISLGSSDDFGFYFFDTASGTTLPYAISVSGESYTLSAGGATVSVSDASDPAPALAGDPTSAPLPAPAILFGSGLLGLIGLGIGRRRKGWRQLNRAQTGGSLQII